MGTFAAECGARVCGKGNLGIWFEGVGVSRVLRFPSSTAVKNHLRAPFEKLGSNGGAESKTTDAEQNKHVIMSFGLTRLFFTVSQVHFLRRSTSYKLLLDFLRFLYFPCTVFFLPQVYCKFMFGTFTPFQKIK